MSDEGGEVGWLRAQLARVTVERDQLQQHLDAQRELGQMLTAYQPAADGSTGPLPAVSAQRPRSHRARATHLRLVKVLIPGAIIGALKCAWHAHPVATAAATTAAFTVAGTTAAVVVAPHGIVAQALGATPVASAPADGISSAAPFASPSAPVSLRLIGALTRPGRLDARTASGLPPVTVVPAPAYQPPASSASFPSQQAQPSPSSQAGSAGVQVSGTDPSGNIDLSAGPVTLTLTATGGGGWASWRIDAHGASDLTFSKTGGVLRAGQSEQTDTVVVSVAPARDAVASEAFTIAGSTVIATLPQPVPSSAPVVDPSPAPTDTMSPVPSSS